ncbi:Uncharacterized protein YbcI [Marininema mesophilum]|uniref:Uncharacterized protein YbcI n=1 Tax=Marininema mesophilum TaxID=1048340 RepID=A0A1H2TQ37_9BACL|nr:Na-translocating system protein MpsC family protein [Marininema mesophilum]SDW46043.1 Uncharacterized protein YbcI [Marininema mesophilum]
MAGTLKEPRISKGVQEAKVCELFTRVHKELVGKGTRQVRCRISEGLLIVEQEGVLTKEEESMLRFDERGHLIREIRSNLYEMVRSYLEEEMKEIVGYPLQFIGFDVRPMTGEIRVTYSLIH